MRAKQVIETLLTEMPQYRLKIKPGEFGYDRQVKPVEAKVEWPGVGLDSYGFETYFTGKRTPSATIRAHSSIPGISTGKVRIIPYPASAVERIRELMGEWDRLIRATVETANAGAVQNRRNPPLTWSQLAHNYSPGEHQEALAQFRAAAREIGLKLNGVIQQARAEIQPEVEKARQDVEAKTIADINKKFPGVMDQVLMDRPDSIKINGTPAMLSRLLGKFKTLYLSSFNDPSEASDAMAEFVAQAGPGQKVLKLECTGAKKAALYVLADKAERAEVEAIARNILKKKVSDRLR